MKKLILLCLALCLLVCLVGCGKKDTPAEPTEEDNMSEETYSICGHPMEEYKILKSSSAIDAALIVRAAIGEQAGVQLQTVSKMPADGKAIRFVIDAHAAPGACRIYTEGETLNIAAFDADFFKQSAEKFQTLLESGQKSFDAGFDTSVDFDRIAIADVPASATWKMVGDVDRDAISYGIGDRAYLNLAVAANGKIVDVPYFYVYAYNEATGTSPIKYEYIKSTNGVLSLRTDKINIPGFYYWNVSACDANRQKLPNMVENDMGYHFQGAAGFAVEGITGVTECPADFDAFWFGIADEVRGMNAEPAKIMQVSGKEGYIVYYVELPCGTDERGQPGVVSAYLSYPEWASPTNPVKLRIGFQGHGRSAASPDYYAGTAALAVCAHSIDSERCKSDTAYRDEAFAAIHERFGFEETTRENMYFYRMIKRDLLGLRFLIAYCGQDGLNIWNGQDLIAGGGSMGGFQATVMGALAERVTGHNLSLLDLSKPWLCDTNAGSAKRRASAYCPDYNRTAVRYYDTLNFAHLITCETTIYAGLGDSTCTASAMQSLYNALTCKKSITFEQNVSHNFGSQYSGSRSTLSADAQPTQ